MRRRPLRDGVLAVLTGALLLLASCGSGGASKSSSPVGSSTGTGGGRISVVTSTNVYGDIAHEIGGDAVQVSAIISDPEQDPHSYEANTRVALQLSRAGLVVENGGGYDDFVDTMLRADRGHGATQGSPVVLNAVAISGLRAPAGGELNEHVWYDLSAVRTIAGRIATELSRLEPSRATAFRANAARFVVRLDRLIRTEARLKQKFGGDGVGITEPVPLYLLEAVGLVNKTPAEFSEAVEEGEDVSAAVLKETLDLYRNKQVKALVYNAQTSGPVTEQVLAAAQQAGIAQVPVTETLPQGQTYLSWMRTNLADVGRALGSP